MLFLIFLTALTLIIALIVGAIAFSMRLHMHGRLMQDMEVPPVYMPGWSLLQRVGRRQSRFNSTPLE